METFKKKTFLIDIGHPAHVHYFYHFAKIMINKGHEVVFTCRDKDVVIALLANSKLRYFSFGKSYKSIIGKFFGLFYFTARFFLIALKIKPDYYLNATLYSAIVAWIMGKPHISLEDTFNMEQVKLYSPFTNVILTGDYNHPSLGKKEITYSGYQELLYLHPKYFSPNPDILNELKINPGEKYVILRFVSWNASHDIGHKGINHKNKLFAIQELSKYAKVFISSESKLPLDFEKYRIQIQPHQMHDVLFYASLLWGESFTMPAECSALGTPSIINHNTKSYYLYEQENKYDLCYNYTESEEDQIKAIAKGVEILQIPDLKEKWIKKRDKMLSEKIDVTSFLVWFIENYPQSVQVIKENPDYQYNFR